MLTVTTNPRTGSNGASSGADFGRRDFLRIGALSLGSLTLADLVAARAVAGEDFVRDRSVVLLYLSGGASHIETFDPKLTAPPEIRSMTGEAATPIPGVTFGGTFPQLARLADRMAVVRSFHHGVGDHVKAHVHVLTGGTDPDGAGNRGFSMGSAFARLRGANHPASGLPTFTVVTSPEVDGQYRNEQGRLLKGSQPGSLGLSYAPFHHTGEDDDAGSRRSRGNKGGSLAADMQLSLPADRFDDRRSLLRELDNLNRQIDARGGLAGVDKLNEQAANLVLGGAAAAFDVKGEDPRLLQRYDTSHIRIGHKVFRPSTLGRQMLLARRLCEAGCGFVTVHSAGWDMHADGNNPGIVKGMEMLGRSVDKAVSAFLEDVRQRGLSDKILLVITGDFGRTPKVNSRGGRDHWSRLGTLAFAGGGLNMGQVVGQSARGADVPATEPYTTSHLMATVMHSLFDLGKLRLASGVPREVKQAFESAAPITELVV
ncbi:MAG: DUF1501 domain-containing protein [Pirellulaceae bacterium]|nr:DUF1501 domain-containing protein [Planctomycetales bacterium]